MRTMWINLYDKLLNGKAPASETFKIAGIPEYPNHKIGIDENMSLCLLVQTLGNSSRTLPTRKLRLFGMLFNKRCRIASEEDLSSGKVQEGNYSILTLKPVSRDLQIYFLSICKDLLDTLGDAPQVSEVAVEINKVVSLFQYLSLPPLTTVQGLFGELTVINESRDADYLVKAWHIDENDTYDFDDGIQCLEIKSTSQNQRIHTFSQNQMTSKKNKPVFVGSVFINRSDFGISIFQLLDMVKQKIKNKNLIFKLDKLVLSTIGNEIENTTDLLFDYDEGANSLKFYDLDDLPKIMNEDIPQGVTGVKYNVSLENLEEVNPLTSNLLSKISD